MQLCGCGYWTVPVLEEYLSVVWAVKARTSAIPDLNTRPSPSKEGSYEATVAELTSKRSRIAQMQASTSSALRPLWDANWLAGFTASGSRTSRSRCTWTLRT